MQTEYIWIALAVILLLAEFWAIRSVLRSGASKNSRCMWMAVIIFAPLFGMLAWWVAGPKPETQTS
ncbi:Phospholipase_D-nuclease N-terminal [Pseudomonas taetrolens]|uniref:Phospholipase_D-nuclease N-terminal n=1 Tax=Pseudomonas taetrolens TaxID=47884 RepID=A0A0J6JN17_PSETA|nr:PLD nuclease N-terminal domain-containing protein [Pseudomonas taetrolens]KMM85197.1 hypothetical protein TU78_07500 [Pseudomonas taetrolens]SEC44165.1 Phospholipase_D-nuclease N-terminal [Pseudomonas taetrolens]SQF86573.1 Uncharacterised protein [Pseudomonas taetrolens]VEH49650.1 Uncharacterised protein [Pseudomonas taetrolens]